MIRIRYEIEQALYDGPIYTLYSARDRVQSKDVFLRVLKAPFQSETAFIEALKKTLEKTSSAQHPALERILELDEDEGTYFLVGEASSGGTLTERIRKLAPFSVPVSVATAIGICEALSAVHSSFLVHGDVGPHNVYVSSEGDVRLQMAGIWEAYSASATAGSVVLPNMAPYLAPEVSKGAMPSPSSDIYAVGVILFELLAGRKPYLAEQPVAIAMMHATEPTPELRSLNPSVPVALNEIVKKAMAKDPEQRYRSAGEMLSDLRMVRDALRFGRSLNWPLQPGTAAATEPQPVSPVASTGKDKEKGRKADDIWVEDIDDEPADIPTWLKMTMVFFGSLVVFMVGGWILFNLSKPKMLMVPSLHGLTVSEAEQRLKPLGLTMRISGREANEQLPAETVISSTPSAGTRVYEGNAVGVTVSSGSKFVEVPDLRGLPADRAKAMLDTLGLKLDERISETRNREVDAGLIVSQVPEQRKKVERGTRVRVTISSGNRRSSSSPEDDKRYLYTISIRLTDITKSVELRVDMTDSRGTRTVHDSTAEPEENVEVMAEGYGDEVVFRIFYDGELIKQVTKRGEDDGEEVR